MPAIEVTSVSSGSVRELPKSWEACQHGTALTAAGPPKLASDEEPLIAREYPELGRADPSPSEGAARAPQRRWLAGAILLVVLATGVISQRSAPTSPKA